MLYVIIFPNSGITNFKDQLKLQHGGRTVGLDGLITDFSFSYCK